MNKLNELRNPWISLSFKVWNRLVTQKHLREAVKVLRWCVYDLKCVPGRWDAIFKFWSSKGLTAYCTYFLKGSMNSFQNLKGQFDLKRDDFYRFLQVCHYINQIQRESTHVLQKGFQVDISFKFEYLYIWVLYHQKCFPQKINIYFDSCCLQEGHHQNVVKTRKTYFG